MVGKVNNGERIEVDTGEFSGLAGYQDGVDGPDFLSYLPNRSGDKPDAGAKIIVKGKERTVTKRVMSTFVPGMVTLSLEPLGGD
jgi:hypothetical protein